MKIVMIGAGGVGGHHGAMLARAGHDVTFQARGAHLEAMQRCGLRIQTPTEDFTVPVRAVADASGVEGAELVVLAVKSYSLPEVAVTLRRLGEGGATILPLLNGIDIADRCAALGIPRAAVLGGISRISVVKAGPGLIIQDEPKQHVELGELQGRHALDLDRFAEAFRSAGIEAVVSPNIELALWRKYVSLASRAALCGMGGGHMDAVRARPYGTEAFHRAVAEAAALARACGIPFTADLEAQIRRDGDAPSIAKPSFVADLERGGCTEIDTLSGTISRLGRQKGVPTPVHDLATFLFAHTAPGVTGCR